MGGSLTQATSRRAEKGFAVPVRTGDDKSNCAQRFVNLAVILIFPFAAYNDLMSNSLTKSSEMRTGIEFGRARCGMLPLKSSKVQSNGLRVLQQLQRIIARAAADVKHGL